MAKRKPLSEAFGVEPAEERHEVDEPSSLPEESTTDRAEDQQQEATDATESTQYGKRADPNYTQISGNIPELLKRRFKAKVSLEGRDISSTLEEIIREYVERD